uniref:Histone-lysine N-methyltransferase SETMAR n=1 Tax=Heterorhabditis bacteriophora TaxID=37862 RepID=A0A1I7XFJ2_HETBA
MNLDDRVVICTSLLARNKIEPFLNRMITGDEKWITYESIHPPTITCFCPYKIF